jgi:DNA-directed RNA polymerase subunit RPC12/RpoP
MHGSELRCTKCGAEMERGFIKAPVKNIFGMELHRNLTEWFAGEPPRGERSHPVTVYRCRSCGLLESYAK